MIGIERRSTLPISSWHLSLLAVISFKDNEVQVRSQRPRNRSHISNFDDLDEDTCDRFHIWDTGKRLSDFLRYVCRGGYRIDGSSDESTN